MCSSDLEVDKGNFRKDLYYRLNVLPLRLPSLRERQDDIPLLIEYFMDRKSKKLNKKKVQIPKEYMDKLLDYEWPGNIRELENLVELIINTESIPDEISSDGASRSSLRTINEPFTLAEIEAKHIRKALVDFKFNITKTSESLGISRNTLYRKMDQYKINDSKQDSVP